MELETLPPLSRDLVVRGVSVSPALMHQLWRKKREELEGCKDLGEHARPHAHSQGSDLSIIGLVAQCCGESACALRTLPEDNCI